ncbi:IS200/IS605 family transposase, partial [bacterium]|nr:IS200/IS605 family transposase [bacterium]
MKLINIITNKIELNNNYIHDKHLVSRCFYHVIFCTKYSRKVINDEVAERMKSLLEESQQKYNFQLIEYEIMPEHVHLLILC